MKLTPKIFSIAPYLSTPWSNISSLLAREEAGAFRLMVLMKDGLQAEIPHLSREAISLIFHAHAKYAEQSPCAFSEEQASSAGVETLPFSFNMPMSGDKNTIEAFNATTRHNPEQANLPPLPPGVLKKIAAIAKVMMGVENLPSFPKGEVDCSCIYCQVMNALNEESATQEPEEEISAEDLRFRSWDVLQTSEKLYTVTNPVDTNEYYSVFLGSPLGCTCGHKNCEHIRAVLNS